MERIVNRRTNTVHKPRQRDDFRKTKCGVFLDDANTDRVTTDVPIVTDDGATTSATMNRCGRCFEEGSGY
ncbi:hypothetical protein SAMN05216285_4032 [Natrinema salifodinae]|uniref:Uncharacterized protein n=1 Tax=Natrinema salifodinae TaxID=1202768 RepID=A0A1I0QVG7_9EURY|nr:hypothetical protein SAMN05216285_4032 [Natrinema salifodinae]